ncbi:MAG TPA: VWA domain-containing protein [Thermoanaerobaculia bacterium]|nr:VWA domain-containing protein [Thermoanaerobaculia bacterium]
MSTRSHLQRTAALLAGVAMLVALPTQLAAAKSYSEAAEVVVVEVPVQVIAGGEPVRGLTAANFELYDGRKKVPVTGFEMLDVASAPASGAAVDVPASARRHFMLLFDLTFSDPTSLLRAREAAKNVLRTLHATDLVGVSTYSAATGPQMILGFTPDRAQAAAAIETLGLPKFFNRAADPLRLVITPDVPTIMEPSIQGRGTGAKEERDAELKEALDKMSALSSRSERNVDQMIVRNMTTQFTDLARTMAAVDGRKYVVLLSEGFDSSLVTGSGNSNGNNDLNNQVDSAGSLDVPMGDVGGFGSDETFGDTRTQNSLEKMLTEFRRADCQIQAVDIGGLRALAGEGRLEANGRESLLTMAKDTGGELFENFNDLAAAMGAMLRRTGVTYVLTFQPEGLKPDGEFHKLRVELKNAPGGARVVSRPGYYAPRPFKEQTPLQKALEAADSVMGQEGGSIDAAVLAAPFAAKGNSAYVPIVVEVGGQSLLAGKQESALPVEIYVYAIDEGGAVQGYRTQSLALDVAKSEALLRQSGLKFFGHLDLPPGKYAIRTLVRNSTTGASSLRVNEVVVPAAGEPALLPPFFPEAAGRWLVVRETLAQGEAQPPYPFMLSGAPFIPASRPLLAAGQAANVVLQGYNLGGDLTAKVEVLGADGTVQPGGVLELGKASGSAPRVVTGTFKAPQLRPGEYRLRVTVTDGAGKSATSVGAFAVGV